MDTLPIMQCPRCHYPWIFRIVAFPGSLGPVQYVAMADCEHRDQSPQLRMVGAEAARAPWTSDPALRS